MVWLSLINLLISFIVEELKLERWTCNRLKCHDFHGLVTIALKKAGWLSKCLLCMHAIFDLQVELGNKEDVYSNGNSDDGLDEQSGDAITEQNTSYNKQSRRQTAPTVPGWVNSELRWVCQLCC